MTSSRLEPTADASPDLVVDEMNQRIAAPTQVTQGSRVRVRTP
ncbi:MAG: hypothetical protein ACYC5W_18310 [Thauera sp.]